VNSYHLKAPKTSRDDDFSTGARFHMLGVLRNECLSEVAHRTATGDKIDIMAIVDVDGDLVIQDLDLNGVAHTFGLKWVPQMNWDAACTNGVTVRGPQAQKSYFEYLSSRRPFDPDSMGRRLLKVTDDQVSSDHSVRAITQLEDSQETAAGTKAKASGRQVLAGRNLQNSNEGVQVNVCPKNEACSAPSTCDKQFVGEASLAHCLNWRNTGDCSAEGPREPNLDVACAALGQKPSATVTGSMSGFCECSDGSTIKFSCEGNRGETKCEDECAKGKMSATEIVKTCANTFHVSITNCAGSSAIKYMVSAAVPQSSPESSCDNFKETYSSSIQIPVEGSNMYIRTCVEQNGKFITQIHRLQVSCIPEVGDMQLNLQWGFRDSMAFRDGDFTKNSFRDHEGVTHLPHDIPIKVEGCFGGLAFYDLTTAVDQSRGHWRNCFYAAHDDNDCEHVSYHKCLTEKMKWKFILNPRMWLYYAD